MTELYIEHYKFILKNMTLSGLKENLFWKLCKLQIRKLIILYYK